jgi:hypothetical protein
VIRERKIYGQMWPSHGKSNRAGFRVTLRVQPSREQKIEALATPELYGQTVTRHALSGASQRAQANARAAIKIKTCSATQASTHCAASVA